MIEMIVVKALEVVAAAAPGLLAALTSRQSDEEAIAAARELAEALPVREAGATGTWDRDLAERKERGQ